MQSARLEESPDDAAPRQEVGRGLKQLTGNSSDENPDWLHPAERLGED